MHVLRWLETSIMSLKMAKESKIKIGEIVDNFLLVNLFTVVFFAIFFIFAVIMKINRVNFFLDFVQKIWNPLILPLITVLIISALTNGIISLWKRISPVREEDI